MKKAILFLFILITNIVFVDAQTCTPANTPNLGPDRTVFVSCFRDVANLTSLYNTTGLTTQWDITNPATAQIGYHRLIATNGSGCKDTAYINVKQEVKKWLGTINTDWHNPANWSDSIVPGINTHVLIIGETPNPCTIDSSDAFAASIRVKNYGQYSLLNGYKLHITGHCDTLPPYFEVGAKTILINNETSQTIQLVDSGKVVFNGNTTQLQSLDTSNIIVSGIVPNAPYGFLRKVKSIQHTGNVYTITTGDVPMETAFKDFYFEYSQPYTKSDTSLQQRLDSAGIANSIPVDLSYQFSANVSAYGSLTITPRLTVLIDISNYHLNYAKIEGSFERKAIIGFNINGAASASAEALLYEKMLRPFVIPYTPLVVVPTLKVKIGAEVSTDVAYSASIDNTSSVSTFLEYEQDTWHNGYERSTSTETNFSGVNGNVNAKLWVEPSIDFKLYNQNWAKGTIKAKVYVTGEAHTLPRPSCKLTAGVTAGIAANLKMLGINFFDVDYPELFKTEKLLYECFNPKISTIPLGNNCDSVWRASVTDTGRSRLRARGFCWNTTGGPKVTDYKKETPVNPSNPSGGVGTFTDIVFNLKLDTIYHVRPYAINTTDTAYGDEFTYSPPVHIGDTIGGGIAFYLEQNCRHGLVAAFPSSIALDSVQWVYMSNSSYPNFTSPLGFSTSQEIGYGMQNTIVIAAGPAASRCRSFTGGGFNNWFLPTTKELKEFYNQKSKLPVYPLFQYWTSTGGYYYTIGSIQAYRVDVLYTAPYPYSSFVGMEWESLGNTSNGYFSRYHNVIPVRKF